MTKIYHFDNNYNKNLCQKYNITLTWEKEVLTEYKSYQYIKNSDSKLPLSYIAYPWALLIDYYHNKFNKIFDSFFDFLSELGLLKQLELKNDYSITVVQSYHFDKYLDDFKKLGIRYIFSPHIVKNNFLEIFYKFGIVIYPYYIYPSIKLNNKNNIGKHLIYNFIGNVNYSSKRPTIVRNNIVNMKNLSNSIVKKLNEWHFNKSIYNQQLNILKSELDDKEINKNKEKRENEYRKVMETSLFSICPLGIGPNSIRLWESFTYNTIPVSISDDLWLPFYINVNWNNLMLNIKEDDYKNILNLKNISFDKINKYQEEIDKFNKRYLSEESFGSIINDAFKVNKDINLLLPWFNHPDKNSLRFKEIHECLKTNINNKYIKRIIFFYEVKSLDEIDFDYYMDSKIKIIPVITCKKRDINFNMMVKYANKYLLNEICIISNNDIYYDDTLEKLFDIDFQKNNYFISLTRKNIGNYLDNKNKLWKPHSASQDSWIFVSPLQLMKNDINLGWIQCDNIISYEYNYLGYNVINPHYSINAWHLHMFNNTDLLLKEFNYNYQYKMMKVELKSIETIKKDKIKVFKFIKDEPEIKDNDIEEIIKLKKIDIGKLSNLKRKWVNKNCI